MKENNNNQYLWVPIAIAFIVLVSNPDKLFTGLIIGFLLWSVYLTWKDWRNDMPSVSVAQEKLMRIAAHKRGGYGGVPQKVGAEFEAADEAKAALKPRSKMKQRYAKKK